MSSSRGRLRALVLTGTAAGGVVAGHIVAYALLSPRQAERVALLHRSGHGYFPRALVAAIFLSAVAAAVAAGLGYRRGRAVAHRVEPASWLAMAARLAVFQGAGFVLLESVERAVAGAGLADLAALLLLGLGVQVLVAGAGAALLVMLDRAGEQVALTLRAPWARRPRPILRPGIAETPVPRLAVYPRCTPLRGPPTFA
jgi:hypothetical protein